MTNSKLLSLAYKFYYHLILTYFCSFLNLPALIHVWFLLHNTFNLFLGINVLLPRMSLAPFFSFLNSYLSFRTTQRGTASMESFLTSLFKFCLLLFAICLTPSYSLPWCTVNLLIFFLSLLLSLEGIWYTFPKYFIVKMWIKSCIYEMDLEVYGLQAYNETILSLFVLHW